MTDFVKGQTATFSARTSVPLYVNSHNFKTFQKGTTGVITVVRKNTIGVTLPYDEKTNYVFSVPRSVLETPNGEVWTPVVKPATRKIGDKPEGDHLDKDDPRIQWIFEDAARVAKNSGHCWEYDNLCDRLGIPGRLRDIEVKTTINGLSIVSTVKARSKDEAEKIVKEKITAAKA